MARKVDPAAQKLALEQLIQAGIWAISKEGIDQISVQSVSAAAKTSRPTFYSYLGDINGLLAEIWIAKSDYWLDMLSDSKTPVTKLNSKDKSLHRAMTEILAIAHRNPEVLEVVEPRMKQWWGTFAKGSELEKLKLVWLVSQRLGATLTDPVDPNAHQAAFIEGLLEMLPNQISEKLPKLNPPKLSEPEISTDSIDARLLSSAIAVIANSGVKNASMARIARKAQVSTGAVYPRFSKVEHLVEVSFEYSISQIVRQNLESVDTFKFKPDDYGEIVIAGLAGTRKIWRNFRIEIHLGARTRPNLAKRMKKNLESTAQAIAPRLSKYTPEALGSGPIPFLIHSIGIGAAILDNAGLPVAQLDHRVITRLIVGAVSGP